MSTDCNPRSHPLTCCIALRNRRDVNTKMISEPIDLPMSSCRFGYGEPGRSAGSRPRAAPRARQAAVVMASPRQCRGGRWRPLGRRPFGVAVRSFTAASGHAAAPANAYGDPRAKRYRRLSGRRELIIQGTYATPPAATPDGSGCVTTIVVDPDTPTAVGTRKHGVRTGNVSAALCQGSSRALGQRPPGTTP